MTPFPNIDIDYKKKKYTIKAKGPEPTATEAISVREILDLLPCISEMAVYNNIKDLRMALDEIHPLCYPILKWIITSNRAHIVPLEPRHSFPNLNTDCQFVMLTSSPEREKAFQEEKKRYGSFYAFHGSGFGNWHCIFRVGLKNYSRYWYIANFR